MPYRQLGPRLQMLNKSHVRGCDRARIRRGEAGELAIRQFLSQYKLQHGIGSGGSTAQVPAARRLHIESKRSKLYFDSPAQSLAMLQRARCVEGDAPDRAPQLTFE